MNFIETANGSFISVDDISVIYHEYSDDHNCYFSYLKTKSGEVFDFLCLPNVVIDENGKEEQFDGDWTISLHLQAVELLAKKSYQCFQNEGLYEEAWNLMVLDRKQKLGKKDG